MAALITRSEINRAGLTRSELEASLRCCMVRVRPGVYALRHECSASAHLRLRALFGDSEQAHSAEINRSGLRGHTAKLKVLVDSYRGVLTDDCAFSHLSAALLWGFPLTRPIQNRVEAIRTSRSCEYRQLSLRKRTLPRDDVTSLEGARVTTVRRTLSDVARDYPLDVSVPMIDHALRTGHVTPQEVAELSSAIVARRGAPRARTAFTLANALRESPAESICAVRFHELNIEGFVPQVEFGTHADGFIARVDFLHRGARVIVEVNGEIKYTGGKAGTLRARSERYRDYKLRNLDYRVYQLAWSDLFRRSIFNEIKFAVRAAT